jgi:hypothetical protein
VNYFEDRKQKEKERKDGQEGVVRQVSGERHECILLGMPERTLC